HLLHIAIPPPPTHPLFPYTTLFRSSSSKCAARLRGRSGQGRRCRWTGSSPPQCASSSTTPSTSSLPVCMVKPAAADSRTKRKDRSEEHTSELQSRENLVCRLLLEKK